EVDARVEAEPALVGAEGAVELDPEAAVDVDLAVVGLPRHPEDDLALRLADALDDLLAAQLGVLAQERAEGGEALTHLLGELGLRGVAAEDIVVHVLELLVDHRAAPCSLRRR